MVGGQLAAALENQGDLAGLVVAYEPVWAIGTGLTATPEEAQAMHDFIRRSLEKNDKLDAAQTRLLYGGSVRLVTRPNCFPRPISTAPWWAARHWWRRISSR